MKLELDIQSAQNQSVNQNSVNSNGFDANHNEEVKKLLRVGINAAKEGNRAEARLTLLQVTETDPNNETAWLWLASISEYPEELLVFLQNVLKINPENERALEWSKQTKSLLSKTFVQRGIDASHQGQKEFAKQCFLQAIVHDAQNEMAWLWLASSTESIEEKCSHLQKVLNINPENETALSSLKSVKNQLAQPFLKKANSAAIAGDHETARQNLEEVMKHSPEMEDAWILKAYLAQDFYEKIACYEKALEINPEHDAAHAGLASLKALVSKSGVKLPEAVEEKVEQEVFEEKVENVAVETEQEPENLLETVQDEVAEVENSHNEPVELFSEVFDAPTGELDQEVMQQVQQEEFGSKVYQNEEEFSDEAEAQQADSQVAEESVEVENKFETEEEKVVEEGEQTQFFEESEPAQEVSFQTEEAKDIVEEVAQSEFAENEEVEAQSEIQEELTAESQTETPASFEESAETETAPAFEPETQFVEEQAVEAVQESVEQQAAEENQEPVEESQKSFVEHLNYYQPEENFAAEEVVQTEEYVQEYAQSEETDQNEVISQTDEVYEMKDFQNFSQNETPVHQETVQEVEQSAKYQTNEPVEYQAEYPSTNGVGTFTQAETYADYQQPTVEFSYQNATSYTDPTAETLTSYTPQETVTPQPNNFVEEESEVEEKVQEVMESVSAPLSETQVEPALCPFCSFENEPQVVTCNSCQAMLSLSDLEMLLAHQNANQNVMLQAIERMEVEKDITEFNADELRNLGLAHLNAHNLRKGFSYLQEASQLNPNDVVLSSKVNFLAIRLSEIEEYDQKAQENPVQSRTIMVVDDSPTVRKLITGKLEKCGHSVVSAVDGMDALAKINEVIPDLVLLDITMPRLDGYQVCKLIRNNEITKDIPVVMISGKDGFFDKVRGRMAGSTGYITKPFGPDTLMKTIETYLA